MKRFIVAFFLLYTLFGISQEEYFYSSNSIPKELNLNANAVIRLQRTEIIIESKDKVITKLKRIITVLNENGNYLVTAGAGYDNFRKVKSIEAKIYDDKGNLIERKRKKDFIDRSAVDGGTLYSDSRVMYMSYFPLSYPYTVEFEVQIESVNTATLPTWRPIEDYYLSVEMAQYSIKDFANLNLRYKENFFDLYTIEKSKNNNEVSYIIKNIPAFKYENMSHSLRNITPYVMFAVDSFHYNGVDGTARNWEEFGGWMYNTILKDRDRVSNETKMEILSLTEKVSNPIQKAKLIYNYIQENTRYISVQVGIGGIQPIEAIEVDRLKYGDCKGLTNYTQALLKIVGVDSFYTIVQSGNEIEDFDEDFATLEQGNHIILAIPNKGDLIWLDCTSQSLPFGFIGDFTDNRNVLLVKPDSSKIVKTTKYESLNNKQLIESDITLSSDSSIRADVKIISEGIQYDNKFLLENQPNEEVINYYKKYWRYINGLEIKGYEFLNAKDSIQFSENLLITASDYASINSDRIIFHPNFFNRNTYVPERIRNRKFPLTIHRGFVDEDTYSINIPDAYTIESLPEIINIHNEFGEYVVESKVIENQILYYRKLMINEGEYDKSLYNKYREFWKKISKHDSSIAVLKKKL